MKYLAIILLLLISFTVNAAVRYNPHLRIYEGNICMNNIGWQIVQWQPLGSICYMRAPNGQMMQGIIINA